MNDKKKKKYQIPESEIVEFSDEDIITLSGAGTLYWGDEDDTEKPL